MSQINSFKFYPTNYTPSHFKIIRDFLSGILGVVIGLMIGSHLGLL